VFTDEQVLDLIANNDEAVERAILRIAALHESSLDEEVDVGFMEADARILLSFAVFIEASTRKPGNRLSSGMLTVARSLLTCYTYVDQLVKYANSV